MLRELIKRVGRWRRRREYVTEATRQRLAWEVIERELQRCLDGPDDAEALVVAAPIQLELVPVVFLCAGCHMQLRIAVHPATKDRLHRAWDQVHGHHQGKPELGRRYTDAV